LEGGSKTLTFDAPVAFTSNRQVYEEYFRVNKDL